MSCNKALKAERQKNQENKRLRKAQRSTRLSALEAAKQAQDHVKRYPITGYEALLVRVLDENTPSVLTEQQARFVLNTQPHLIEAIIAHGADSLETTKQIVTTFSRLVGVEEVSDFMWNGGSAAMLRSSRRIENERRVAQGLTPIRAPQCVSPTFE